MAKHKYSNFKRLFIKWFKQKLPRTVNSTFHGGFTGFCHFWNFFNWIAFNAKRKRLPIYNWHWRKNWNVKLNSTVPTKASCSGRWAMSTTASAPAAAVPKKRDGSSCGWTICPQAASWRCRRQSIGWQKQPSTNCAPSAWLRAAIPMPWMTRWPGCCTRTPRCCSGEEDAERAREWKM